MGLLDGIGGSVFDSGEGSLRAGASRAHDALKIGKKKSRRGFKRAEKQFLKALLDAQSEIARVGQSATQRTLDREKQLVGGLQQSMQSRGLANTTVGANLQRGIHSDTNRSLAEIDEALAQLRSGLVFRGRSQLGNLYSNRGRQVFGQQTEMANLWLGRGAQLAQTDQYLGNLLTEFAKAGASVAGGGGF